MAKTIGVKLCDLNTLISSVLTSKGLNSRAANSIAYVVCDAERDGCTSHGLVSTHNHSLKNISITALFLHIYYSFVFLAMYIA